MSSKMSESKENQSENTSNKQPEKQNTQQQQLPTTVIDYGNGIYAIDQQMVRAFLIVGNERAILLDTGMIRIDIRAEIETVTKLPVDVILTHCDRDHVGNLQDFDCARIHENDMSAIQTNPEYSGVRLIPVSEGDEFDIGGRSLKAVFTPGHTAGSICLLDEVNHILFSGDTVSYGPVYMFGEHRNMDKFIATLQKLIKMRDAGIFDTVYACHNISPLPAKEMDDLLACAEGIKNKTIVGEKANMPIPTDNPPLIGKHGNCRILFM